MSETNKIEAVIESIRSWGRTIKMCVAGIAVLATSYLVPKFTSEKPQPAEKQEVQTQQATLPAPAPIAKVTPVSAPASPAAPSVTAMNPGMSQVSFVVQSVGKSKSGKAFLNSNQDYRLPGNQVIVLTGPAAQANLDGYKGRTVTAHGVVSYYRGNPQIEVNNLASLQVQ